MTPTPAEITRVLQDATGNPSSGPIHDWIPTLAAAKTQHLTPNATQPAQD